MQIISNNRQIIHTFFEIFCGFFADFLRLFVVLFEIIWDYLPGYWRLVINYLHVIWDYLLHIWDHLRLFAGYLGIRKLGLFVGLFELTCRLFACYLKLFVGLFENVVFCGIYEIICLFIWSLFELIFWIIWDYLRIICWIIRVYLRLIWTVSCADPLTASWILVDALRWCTSPSFRAVW